MGHKRNQGKTKAHYIADWKIIPAFSPEWLEMWALWEGIKIDADLGICEENKPVSKILAITKYIEATLMS